jgi:hypothetical protein
MTLLASLLGHPIFQLILAFCTIIGVVIAVFALVPAIRNKFFSKISIKVKKQEITGTNNFQTGRNIHLNKIPTKNAVNYHQTSVGSQMIKGDNNKQAGGDINA